MQEMYRIMDVLPLHFIEIAFDENATIGELLSLVTFIAIFWTVVFALVSAVLRPLVHGKPWLIAAGERHYERGGKETYEKMGMAKTKDHFIESFMDSWPYFQAVYLQHIVGGLLCLPAVIGIGNEATASSLACLGVLSEVGYEIEDLITWLCRRYLSPRGKERVPDGFLSFIVAHHSLTTTMGFPMVLRYRNLKTLHLICFDLQFAGAVVMMVQEYTKLLDITIPKELRKFQCCNFFALVVALWTRGVYFAYLSASLYLTWYKDKAWVFLFVGIAASVQFILFSLVFGIVPYYKRFAKFAKGSAH